MRVSIIIPAYNAEATLGRTLRSAREQTWRDLQIIVINDGSVDGTLDLIKKARRSDPRVVLIDQPNAGVAQARNAGLRIATGGYVAILDADDVWHPTKIAKQLECFQSASADTVAVYCWSRVIDEEDRVLATLPGLTAEGLIVAQHVFENVTGNGSSIMVKREVAQAIGFSNALHEAGVPGTDDQLFQLKVAECGRFALVPEYLVGYRRLSSSCTVNKPRMARSVKLCLDLFRSHNRQVPDYVYKWSEAAFAFDLVSFYLRRQEPASAFRQVATAMRLDPVMVVSRLVTLAVRTFNQPHRTRPKPLFHCLSPCASPVDDKGLHARRMRHLARLDEQVSIASPTQPQTSAYTASYARV